jgi:TPR repeat protein
VQNPTAYIAAVAVLSFIALIITPVWLIIEQDATDHYIMRASEGQPEPSIAGADKPPPQRQTQLPAVESDTKPTKDSKTDRSIKQAGPQASNPTDDHYFTVRLYQESAENGNSDAQYKLGLLYLTGNGALQDFAEAAKWLKLAAEQGYALAQYELGLIYRTGHGVAVDQIQSYVWLNLAAAAGIQQAVAAREEVMRSLNGKQLAQAQKASRDWLVSKSKPKTSEGASKPSSDTP